MPSYQGGRSPDDRLQLIALILALFMADIAALILGAKALRAEWPWVLFLLLLVGGTTAATLWVQSWQRKHRA